MSRCGRERRRLPPRPGPGAGGSCSGQSRSGEGSSDPRNILQRRGQDVAVFTSLLARSHAHTRTPLREVGRGRGRKADREPRARSGQAPLSPAARPSPQRRVTKAGRSCKRESGLLPQGRPGARKWGLGDHLFPQEALTWGKPHKAVPPKY